MNAHLTQLERDEASAGLPLEPQVQAHLEACAPCSAAVAAQRSQGEALLSTDAAQQLRAKLLARPVLRVLEGGAAAAQVAPRSEEAASGTPRRAETSSGTTARPAPARRWLAVAGFALAAGLAAVVLLRPQPSRARAGDRVTLAVGAGGATHAAVFALDAKGEVQQLWPKGSFAAAVAAGARVPLSPGFEVTAGAVGLYAAFIDVPSDAAGLGEAVREAFAAARKAGRADWELVMATAGVLWAHTVLEVEP
jgi:hypothetical protein